MTDIEPKRPTDTDSLLDMIREALARNIACIHTLATGPNSRLLSLDEIEELGACSRALLGVVREKRARDDKPGNTPTDPAAIPDADLMRGGR